MHDARKFLENFDSNDIRRIDDNLEKSIKSLRNLLHNLRNIDYVADTGEYDEFQVDFITDKIPSDKLDDRQMLVRSIFVDGMNLYEHIEALTLLIPKLMEAEKISKSIRGLFRLNMEIDLDLKNLEKLVSKDS